MILFHSENLFSRESWLSNYKSTISWFWATSQSRVWKCISSTALVHLKIYFPKLTIYSETKLGFSRKRNWIMKVQFDFFRINSKRKQIRYLDSLSNSGMALNLLKHSLINPRMWKVWHKEHDPICSNRFCNSYATKMKSFKVMKRAISSLSSWDKPQIQMCLRSYSIRNTSSLLSKDSISTITDHTQALLVVCRWCMEIKCARINSIKCNLFNTSVLRLSSRRNTIRKSTSFKREWRLEILNRAHCLMPIRFYKAPRLMIQESSIREHPTIKSIYLIRLRAWAPRQVALISILLQTVIRKSEINSILARKIFQERQLALKSIWGIEWVSSQVKMVRMLVNPRKESNTTSSI